MILIDIINNIKNMSFDKKYQKLRNNSNKGFLISFHQYPHPLSSNRSWNENYKHILLAYNIYDTIENLILELNLNLYVHTSWPHNINSKKRNLILDSIFSKLKWKKYYINNYINIIKLDHNFTFNVIIEDLSNKNSYTNNIYNNWNSYNSIENFLCCFTLNFYKKDYVFKEFYNVSNLEKFFPMYKTDDCFNLLHKRYWKLQIMKD